MPVFDLFHVKALKRELAQARKERDEMRAVLAETGRLEVYELQRAIADLEVQKSQVAQQLAAYQSRFCEERQALNQQIQRLNHQIAARKNELVVMGFI